MQTVKEILSNLSLSELEMTWEKKVLEFKRPSGTSRGILKEKKTWIIRLWEKNNPEVVGFGECGPLVGLSVDDVDDALFELKLNTVAVSLNDVNDLLERGLLDFPSIRFGLEMALLDLAAGGKKALFDTSFVKGDNGIDINGLIWMGESSFMQEQIDQKLKDGFSCIKMKIGAIDFQQELSLLQDIREKYASDVIELRVDANGAFAPEDALDKLKQLNEFELHSIEQPIKQGQFNEMNNLCNDTPLAIALDEELIGVDAFTTKKDLLETIQPQYIILKPTLVGGFVACEEWIQLAEEMDIGWWVTSALESNIGLNAIAQWTSTLNNEMPQGLGTGGLYTNNIDSPLVIKEAKLWIDHQIEWAI